MAITEVASRRATAHVTNALSLNLAFPGNVTEGNLLVVLGALWAGTTTGPTVSDTRSTSYTVYSSSWTGGFKIWIAIGKAPSSGACTVTVSFTGDSGNYSFSIDEFTGQDATTPLRTDGGRATGSGTSASTTVTATANDLILGVVTNESVSSPTLTPGSGYTQIGEEQDNNNYQSHNAEFRVDAGANPTVNWTITNDTWDIYRIAVKPADGGGGGVAIPIFIKQYRARRI